MSLASHHPEYAFICCDQDHGESSSSGQHSARGGGGQHLPFPLPPNYTMPPPCTDESCSIEAFCCEEEHCSPLLADRAVCKECPPGGQRECGLPGNGMAPPNHVCSTYNSLGICDDSSCTVPQFPCSDEDCRFLDEYLRCCNTNPSNTHPTHSSFTEISTQLMQQSQTGHPVHSRNILSPNSFDALLSAALNHSNEPVPTIGPQSTHSTPDMSGLSSQVGTPTYGLGIGNNMASQMAGFASPVEPRSNGYQMPSQLPQSNEVVMNPFYPFIGPAAPLSVSQTAHSITYQPSRPARTQHICHWQNCHLAFDSIPSLLEHISKEHLEPDLPAPIPDPLQALAYDFLTPNVAVPSAGAADQAFRFTNPEMTSAVRSNPFQHKANGHLTCLWDDCLPVIGAGGGGDQASSSAMPTLPAMAVPTHSHSASGSFSKPEQPKASLDSATAVLKHLLEQHLGIEVTRDLLNAAAGQMAATSSHPVTPVSSMPTVQAHQSTHVAGPAMDSVWPEFTQAEVRQWGQGSQHSSVTGGDASRRPSLNGHHHHGHQHSSSSSGQGSSSTQIITPIVRLKPAPPHPIEDAIHRCRWIGCSAVFGDVVALTQHLSDVHILKGKSEYQCLWEGCVVCDCTDQSKREHGCEHGDEGVATASGSGAGEEGGEVVKGRKFTSRQKIMRHLQSHTGYRPFLCHICQQNFSEAATLAAHIKRHTREKTYHCNYPGCEKSFSVESSLMIHKKTHDHKRSFVCTYCDKSFTEVSNLNKHIRTHTGERPFPCSFPECTKRFARPDQQKRHLLTHTKIGGRARKGTGDTSSSPGQDDEEDGDVDMH